MAPLSLQLLCSLLALVRIMVYPAILANLDTEFTQGTLSQSHILQKRAITNPGPAGWTHIGCYTLVSFSIALF